MVGAALEYRRLGGGRPKKKSCERGGQAYTEGARWSGVKPEQHQRVHDRRAARNVIELIPKKTALRIVCATKEVGILTHRRLGTWSLGEEGVLPNFKPLKGSGD